LIRPNHSVCTGVYCSGRTTGMGAMPKDAKRMCRFHSRPIQARFALVDSGMNHDPGAQKYCGQTCCYQTYCTTTGVHCQENAPVFSPPNAAMSNQSCPNCSLGLSDDNKLQFGHDWLLIAAFGGLKTGAFSWQCKLSQGTTLKVSACQTTIN
jgi:hypothetical protein